MLTFLRGAGVMPSKSYLLKAKLSKLPSGKINAACEALLDSKLPNKASRMCVSVMPNPPLHQSLAARPGRAHL